MALPIGGSPGVTRTPGGAMQVNVLDFGAKPDGTTDNQPMIQAAVDALITVLVAYGPTTFGVVYFPSAALPYYVKSPIWLDNGNITVKGDGPGATFVAMFGGFNHPVFICGLHRTAMNGLTPVTIDSTYRPDCFGKLDTSAASATNQKWGLRTNANSFVQFQAGPFAAGQSFPGFVHYSDNWTTMGKFTLETFIEPPAGSWPAGTPIFSCGEYPDQPSPLCIQISQGTNNCFVMFRTLDQQTGSNNINRSFQFSLTGSGPWRIAIQIDLQTPSFAVFLNGVQVALTNLVNLGPSDSSPLPVGNNYTFASNDYFPFFIGMTGATGTFQTPPASNVPDIRLYGLRFSNTTRYQVNGTGTTQTRLDLPGTAVNDQWAYFTNDAHTIAYLPLTDNPATLSLSASRLVTVFHGNASASPTYLSSGLFMHAYAAIPTNYTVIKDMRIAGIASYGYGVMVGAAQDPLISNCKISGGYYAVGALNMLANYTMRMNDCTLDAWDSPYYGCIQLSWCRNIIFINTGRVAIRHVGCGASWDNVTILAGAPNCEGLFKAHATFAGGGYIVNNLLCDFEGSTMSNAAFYCETHLANPVTSLELKDIALGSTGPTAALIMLKDTGAEITNLRCKSKLYVQNLQTYSPNFTAMVDVDGPLWHGEVDGMTVSGTPLKHRQLWGKNTNVTIHDSRYVGVPRAYSWYPGAHVHDVGSPVDGQFTQWRCIGSGTYGTSTPPTFVGLNPILVNPNAIAGYLANHCYATCTMTP